ncbi:hypothetical protein OY671_010190, partial [Metschnikowia pulcherrima]
PGRGQPPAQARLLGRGARARRRQGVPARRQGRGQGRRARLREVHREAPRRPGAPGRAARAPARGGSGPRPDSEGPRAPSRRPSSRRGAFLGRLQKNLRAADPRARVGQGPRGSRGASAQARGQGGAQAARGASGPRRTLARLGRGDHRHSSRGARHGLRDGPGRPRPPL